jgi:hypothetical protein
MHATYVHSHSKLQVALLSMLCRGANQVVLVANQIKRRIPTRYSITIHPTKQSQDNYRLKMTLTRGNRLARARAARPPAHPCIAVLACIHRFLLRKKTHT